MWLKNRLATKCVQEGSAVIQYDLLEVFHKDDVPVFEDVGLRYFCFTGLLSISFWGRSPFEYCSPCTAVFATIRAPRWCKSSERFNNNSNNIHKLSITRLFVTTGVYRLKFNTGEADISIWYLGTPSTTTIWEIHKIVDAGPFPCPIFIMFCCCLQVCICHAWSIGGVCWLPCWGCFLLLTKFPDNRCPFVQFDGTFCFELDPVMIFQWFFYIQNQSCLSTCGACLEVVFEYEWRAAYFGSLRANLILAPLGMPKEFHPRWINIECFLFTPPNYLEAIELSFNSSWVW